MITLEDVLSFVAENRGQKFSAIGGRAEFTAELKGRKAIAFMSGNKQLSATNPGWIEKYLEIFNRTGSLKTTDYTVLRGWGATYTLGLFREVAEKQKLAGAGATLVKDINEIAGTSTDSTTKQRLVEARLGQGWFRNQVLRLWDNRCAVTGSTIIPALRASHIKPWRDSNNAERLDPSNGLPLAASLDALFDALLISFENSGGMLVSSALSPGERAIYGLVERVLVRPPRVDSLVFLEHHRNRFFERERANP